MKYVLYSIMISIDQESKYGHIYLFLFLSFFFNYFSFLNTVLTP